MKFCLAVLLTVFRSVVIPVQFQDREFSCTTEELQTVITSAQGYMDEQFRQTVTFQLDLAPTVTLDKATEWYGDNGEREHDLYFWEAVMTACRASKTVDFSLYDNDSDGEADVVILLTAGCSESDGAGEEKIWPAWSFLSNHISPIVLNGVKIDQYAVFTELKSNYGENPVLNGHGDLCHELCHVFSLPDFYDTDGLSGGGLSTALWQTTSIMDEGNRNNNGQTPPNFNAIEMEILGLGEAQELSEGKYRLSPVHGAGIYLKAPTPADADEYILLECRSNDGWDSFIGGRGLLAYHIDKRKPTWYQKWVDNTVNTDPYHQCAEIIPAAKVPSCTEDVFFPQKGIGYLDLGQYGIDLSLKDIVLESDGSVSFEAIEPISNVEATCFQNSAIVSWETDASLGKAESHLQISEDEELKTVRNSSGNTAVIEGLSPQTEYEFTIEVSCNEGIFTKKGSFTTKSRLAGIPPYIILSGAERDEYGYFLSGARIPLRVNNLPDNSSVEWFLDDEKISVSTSTGYYTITRSGTLKAKISLEDGSTKIIIKELSVK